MKTLLKHMMVVIAIATFLLTPFNVSAQSASLPVESELTYTVGGVNDIQGMNDGAVSGRSHVFSKDYWVAIEIKTVNGWHRLYDRRFVRQEMGYFYFYGLEKGQYRLVYNKGEGWKTCTN